MKWKPASRRPSLREGSSLRAGWALLALATVAAGQVIKSPPLPLPGEQGRRAAAVEFLYPEKVTVAAGQAALIDLHFHVADGLHINSHAPLDKSLIPARLAIVEAPGLNVTAVDFPAGSDYALHVAPHEKLSVYTGDFVLRAHLRAKAGEHTLVGALRYQACDTNACMPPNSIPVQVSIEAH